MGAAASPAAATLGNDGQMSGGSPLDSFFTQRPTPPSTLRPELQRQVEEIARRQEDDLRRQTQNPPQPSAPMRDTSTSDLRAQTQLDMAALPARLKLGRSRQFPFPKTGSRFLNATGRLNASTGLPRRPVTCRSTSRILSWNGMDIASSSSSGHLAAISVTRSTTRLSRTSGISSYSRSFPSGYSASRYWPGLITSSWIPLGKAQYDLGYYRPGDNIPTDTYWLPLHGYGPPLHGSRY